MLHFTRRIIVLAVVSLIHIIGDSSAYASSLKTVAREVAKDSLGNVTDSVDGPNGKIIIFPERHDSPLLRLEIAQMLVRLHNLHQLSAIGLEGEFSSLNCDWIQKKSLKDRIRIAAQTLREGEISSVEYMAIVFPEIPVQGIDSNDLYAVSQPKASPALVALGLTRFFLNTEDQKTFDALKNKVDTQIAQDKNNNVKVEDANTTKAENTFLTFAKDHNPYLKKFIDPQNVHSPANMLALLDDFASHLEQNAEIRPQYEEIVEQQKLFYEATVKRSWFMADQAIKLSQQEKDQPVAIVIGADHSDDITSILKKNNVAFAVIAPAGLNKGTLPGDLSNDALESKDAIKSVDDLGSLGSFLDGRDPLVPPFHNWRAVINTLWYHSKADLYDATSQIAYAAWKASSPTATAVQAIVQPALSNSGNSVQIQWGTYRVENGEIIFQAIITDANRKQCPIWVRVARKPRNYHADKEMSDEALSKRVEALINESGGGGNDDNPPERHADPDDSNSNKPFHISDDAKVINGDLLVIFASDESTVKKAIRYQ